MAGLVCYGHDIATLDQCHTHSDMTAVSSVGCPVRVVAYCSGRGASSAAVLKMCTDCSTVCCQPKGLMSSLTSIYSTVGLKSLRS